MLKNLRVKASNFIDETTKISFKFNGKTYYGFKGDTLASALISNNIHLVGRSFKYHRPRGIMTAGSEEPNAIVQLGSDKALTEPNVRATEVEIYEGLEATSQNCWPSVNFDIGGINNILSPFLPAGFYYKTFMWPASFWEKYEYFIRKSAGLGKSPTEPDPDIYDHKYIHCDVLIIGAGISGIIAAKIAAKNNLKTLLLEEKNEIGGLTIYQNSDFFKIQNKKSSDWLKNEINEIKKLSNLEIKTRTSVAAFHDYNYLLARENLTDHLNKEEKKNKIRQRLLKIRAKNVIIATGSIERPLIFNNNDRPGIMLSSAVKKYADYYGVVCGKKNVLFTNNDSAYESAISLNKKGLNVESIIDIREKSDSELVKEVEKIGIKIYWSHTVVDTHGYKRLKEITIMPLSKDSKSVIEKKINIKCDCLGIAGGWTPAVHLFTQSGGKLKFREEDQVFLPNISQSKQISIGSSNGDFNLNEIIKNLLLNVKNFLEIENTEYDNLKIECPSDNVKKNIWLLPSDKVIGKTKPFVDFQNDATAKDIKLALREGFRSIEHVKRYTTTGMGTDQGKLGNMHALGIVADTAGVKMGELGTTTFRPPYTPLTFGTIVGRNVGEFFDIFRKTPIHEWHEKNNAVFVDAGLWVRPRYYKQDNETLLEASKREATNVRKNVGVCDVTSLGKIDIKGPDCAEFLNRIYTNAWMKLPVGKARYGIMLREDGIVFDDGTTTRISENHFHMTTTTAQAVNVLAHLEYYLQVIWPELDVNVLSTTEQWAGAALAGPNSRNLLSKLFPEIDVSNEAIPFMGYKEADLFGVPARIFRISFSGELAYEINVESGYGVFMWEKIIELGKEMNIEPYGTEALSTLRIEMGHVAGSEIDGRVISSDLSLEGMLSKKKDFIGKRSLNREAFLNPNREKIVGVVPLDKKSMIPEGSHLVRDSNASLPNPKLGHISASCWSVEYNNPFSLAILQDGKKRIGEKLFALSPLKNKNIEVEIVSSHYVDPKGKRVRS